MDYNNDISTDIDVNDIFYQRIPQQFTRELLGLINKYSIDGLLNKHDFVLAHLIELFLNNLLWVEHEENRLSGSGVMDELLLDQ